MSDPSSQAQHLRPGDRVGTYEVLEQVAAGGESIVYHGRDVTLHRSVALKQVVAALDAPDVRSAVLREAARHKAAAASDPTYVLQIIEVLDVARGPIVACEWIDGVTLEHTLAGQTEPMPLKRALGIIAAAAIGLRAIHAAGLVHRDVKPANILLPEAGGVKLADFGLASAIAEHATLSAGSTRYLAPEALRGQPYEPRADLYSLGVVAYEALAGRAAFHRAFRSVLRDEKHTAMRWVKWHTNPRAEAPPLPALVPTIPEPVGELVARLMDKDPARRVATADELLEAFRRLPSVDEVRPDAPGPGRRPPVAPAAGEAHHGDTGLKGGGDTARLPRRRWPAAVAIAVGVLVVIAAVAGVEAVRRHSRAEQHRIEQVRAIYREGRALMKQGRYDAAIDRFERVREAAPGEGGLARHAASGVLLAQGRRLDEAGDHAGALAKLEAAEAMGVPEPDLVRDWIRSSRAGLEFEHATSAVETHLEAGELDRAHAMLRELSDMTALTADEQTHLAALSARLEDQRARERRQNLLAQARTLAERGQRDQAIDRLRRAMQRSPHHDLATRLDRLEREARLEALQVEAQRALDRGDTGAAAEALREMQRIEPTPRRAQRLRALQSRQALSRGRELLASGRPEEAEVALLQSIEYADNEAARSLLASLDAAKRREALIRAGDRAVASGEPARAARHYESAFEIEPGNALREKLRAARLTSAIEGARAALEAGRIEAARAAARQAAGLATDDERVRSLQRRIETRGRYLELLAEADQAREDSDFGRAKRLYLEAREVFDSAEVRRRLDLAEYQHLVAQGRGFLSAQRYDAAKAVLLSAGGIRDTAEVRELLQAIADARAAP